MARLWAMTTTYESVNRGDDLPILLKWGTAATTEALADYARELLAKGFPIPDTLPEGSSLELQTLAPVQAEDTISLSGTVVDKRESNGKRLVECHLTVENQDGQQVAEATAVLAL